MRVLVQAAFGAKERAASGMRVLVAAAFGAQVPDLDNALFFQINLPFEADEAEAFWASYRTLAPESGWAQETPWAQVEAARDLRL